MWGGGARRDNRRWGETIGHPPTPHHPPRRPHRRDRTRDATAENGELFSDHAAKFDMTVAGARGASGKTSNPVPSKPPPRSEPPSVARRRGSWGGLARLKKGHAEKIDCEISEAVFHFSKLYRASLSPPPGPDPHIKTPKFAYTFHAWNFRKMQIDGALSESHVIACGPLAIGVFKIWNSYDIHAAKQCNVLIISILRQL